MVYSCFGLEQGVGTEWRSLYTHAFFNFKNGASCKCIFKHWQGTETHVIHNHMTSTTHEQFTSPSVNCSLLFSLTQEIQDHLPKHVMWMDLQ